jgi:hypothetical protein
MDNNITALTWQADGTLYIGNSDALNWQVSTGEFYRMSGLQGLPIGRFSLPHINASSTFLIIMVFYR